MKTQILKTSNHFFLKIKYFFYKKIYPITILSFGSIFGIFTFIFIFSNIDFNNLTFILKKLRIENIFFILGISIIPYIIDSYLICYISSKNNCFITFKLSFLVSIGKIYLKILFPFGNMLSDIFKCYIFKSENKISFTNVLIPVYSYRIITFASEITYSFTAFYISLFIIYFQDIIFSYPFYINFLPIFILFFLFFFSILIIKIYKLNRNRKKENKMTSYIINFFQKKPILVVLRKIISQKLEFKKFKIKLKE